MGDAINLAARMESTAAPGTVQIAHHYGLPVNVYGLSTNAHDPGLQNGYERALNAAIPALAAASR